MKEVVTALLRLLPKAKRGVYKFAIGKGIIVMFPGGRYVRGVFLSKLIRYRWQNNQSETFRHFAMIFSLMTSEMAHNTVISHDSNARNKLNIATVYTDEFQLARKDVIY